MPTRRLVVALAVLVLGTFGVGVVTAVRRAGEPASPKAQPSPSNVFGSPTPEPTDPESPQPEPSPSESSEPTGSPSPAPTVGGPPAPRMPSTGGPGPLPTLALAALAAAVALKRGASAPS